MVVPAAAMLLWSVVAFAAVGRWASDVPGWIALGVASTPVWAAAAVRASYRPAPDWGGALVSTPMGALPTGVATVLARGPDLVVLGLLPVWIAVLLRTVNAPLLYAQIVLSVIAVAIASSIRTGSLMETDDGRRRSRQQGGSPPVTRIVAGTVGGRMLAGAARRAPGRRASASGRRCSPGSSTSTWSTAPACSTCTRGPGRSASRRRAAAPRT